MFVYISFKINNCNFIDTFREQPLHRQLIFSIKKEKSKRLACPFYSLNCFLHASITCLTSIEVVTAPTPPGTGDNPLTFCET